MVCYYARKSSPLIKKLIVPLQEKLISAIIKGNGNTDVLILDICSSNEFNKDEEETFISFLNDISIRKGIDNFSSPLDLAGYESMRISDTAEQQFTIKKINRNALKYFPPDEIDAREFKDTVSIIYLSPENSKWQFRDKKKFWAEIKDQNFLDRTKHRRFSDLSGKKFSVSGIRIFRREYGELRGTLTWEIHSASEVTSQISMSLNIPD